MSFQRTSASYRALLRTLSTTQHAWLRGELLDRFGRRALDRALAEGSLARMLPGVYAPSALEHEPFTMCSAVSLWVDPHAAVGGVAAAHMLGMTERPFTTVTVSAPHRLVRSAPDWVRMRRTTVEVPYRKAQGIRVVTPADAAIQGWEELAASQRTGFILDAVRTRHVDHGQIRSRLAAYPRVKARRGLEALLGAMSTGGVTSFLEHRARSTVFTGVAFSELIWQAPLQVNGRRYIADALHRRASIVFEFDGAEHHSGDSARRRDIERDAHLASAGFQTLRFTYEDIMNRPLWCRSVALAAIEARLPRGGQARAQRPAPRALRDD